MRSVVSWNVNSLRVRLPHVLRVLEAHGPDVVCLQETRVPDDEFPFAAFEAAGYAAVAHGTGGYAGVAILSRLPIAQAVIGFDGDDLGVARRIACRAGPAWVECVYVPTRRAIGKVGFLRRLRAEILASPAREGELLLAGDFNTCFDERDLASRALISEPDRFPGRPEDLAFRRLLAVGLHDCFRKREPSGGHYTWFDYRLRAFQRNLGLRLDYVFASPALHGRCSEAWHDRAPRGWDRPSDHLPVVARFDDPPP